MELDSETCSWCKHRPGEHTWRDMNLCAGCWIDLTVDEYLRAWSTDPQVGRAMTYKGVPLAATLEYDVLQELIAIFSRLVVPAGTVGRHSDVSADRSDGNRSDGNRSLQGLGGAPK